MYWIAVADKERLTQGLETGTFGLEPDVPALQQIQQGAFLIVYCPVTSPNGEPLKTFSALGRVADTPEEANEEGGLVYRKIAYFSAFDVPLGTVEFDLLYPGQQSDWSQTPVFPIEAPDFLTLAEAMLPPPIFQKVQSVAEDRIL